MIHATTKGHLLCFLILFGSIGAGAQQYSLYAPDGVLKSEITIGQNMDVRVLKEGEVIVRLSGLSMVSQEGKIPSQEFKVRKVIRNTVQQDIAPQIREKSKVYSEHYNELIIDFRRSLSVTFRLFNEGLAYRFSSSAKDSLIIVREHLNIVLNESDSIRFQPSSSFNSSYETPYELKKLGDLSGEVLCHLPALIERSSGTFLMITESDLSHYPGLWLRGTGPDQLAGTNPPYPRTLTYAGSVYNHGQVKQHYDFIAKVKGTRDYPWRVFAVADDERDLINNNMVYVLGPSLEGEDFSWVKPGTVLFDWWGKNGIYGVDFKAGVNTETAKYFIDFCADLGFRYFLFDDGWYHNEKEDLLHEVQGLNMDEVTEYARQKGVDVMLWAIWNTLEKQWGQAFDQFEAWGIKGIKIDFMNRDDQEMVTFYERVVQKAAEKKMVVNFHGAYKPTGLRRKYPNLLTREALIEHEYNGWKEHDTPVHHNILPYIRMFTGPMDYIPGTMRNSTKDNFCPMGDYPMGQGTRVHSMALYVILSSPMIMLPDSPSDYYRERECTEFLADIPVEWEETFLLDGKIAHYTVLARRAGKTWFVGAITDFDSRTVELNTDFLEDGEYVLEVFEDGINADDRAEDYRHTSVKVRAGETLKVSMAPGGGWLARFTPISK